MSLENLGLTFVSGWCGTRTPDPAKQGQGGTLTISPCLLGINLEILESRDLTP